MSSPTVLSLFAGIGGIDLGLERIGCCTIAHSEVDEYASRVFAIRFPESQHIGDITTVDWSTVPDVDIIAGGFPCQDISLAGKGAGIEGSRSGLWTYYADAIRHIRPRGVLVENVAALASRGLDRVLGDLAACGYDAEWDCVPAGAVGAPHLRDRLFVVAYRPDAAWRSGEHAGDRAYAEDRRSLDDVPAGRHASGVCGPDGAGCTGHGRKQGESHSRGRASRAREGAQHRSGSGGQAPTNPGSPRLEGRESPSRARTEVATANRAHQCARWERPRIRSQWRAEPDVGRVAHGIPKRVDRLRCLGNAVVPQVAEHVGRILLDRMGLEVPA